VFFFLAVTLSDFRFIEKENSIEMSFLYLSFFSSNFYLNAKVTKHQVFDFRRSKLVSVIQCFKSFATQTVKHFNHDFQLFDTHLQIIWHFLHPFSIFKFVIIFKNGFCHSELVSESHFVVILSLSKNLILDLNLKYILHTSYYIIQSSQY